MSSESLSLVYVHIDDPTCTFPTYMFDNLYQVYLMHSQNPVPIYVVASTNCIERIETTIRQMNIPKDFLNFIKVVSVESLNLNFPDVSHAFSNTFFINTFLRFYCIEALMRKFDLTNVFHIEYDVMIYTHLNHVYQLLVRKKLDQKLMVVQDSDIRALASIMFVPRPEHLETFLKFAESYLQSSSTRNQNEMIMLGIYADKYSFPNTLDDPNIIELGYYDGAALGQYLGGVDPRNLKERPRCIFINPSVGFINETSTFKPNCVQITTSTRLVEMFQQPLKFYFIKHGRRNIPVRTLHIHSKLLCLFSSAFNLKYEDIITGDRIWQRCDVVISTIETSRFHRNLFEFNRSVLLLEDFELVAKSLSKLYHQLGKTLRVGIYTHILTKFEHGVMPLLEGSVRMVLYIHNSDDTPYLEQILNYPQIQGVYAQNINSVHDERTHLLPIGIANSMWKHGDLDTLFKVASQTYYMRKTKSLFIQMNTSTHPYRRRAMDIITLRKPAPIHSAMPYEEYLRTMVNYRFVLCVRGNGIDVHRFWEALYLGSIPVIVNNKHTEMDPFIQYIRALSLPFYEIRHFDAFFKAHDKVFFSEELYNRLKSDHCNYTERLKLDFYIGEN